MLTADYSVLSLVITVVGLSVLSAFGATLFFKSVFGASRRDAYFVAELEPAQKTGSVSGQTQGSPFEPASMVSESLPYPCWIRTADGRVKWTNDGLLALLDKEDRARADDLPLPSAFRLQQEPSGPVEDRRVVITTYKDGEDLRQWFHLHEVQADDENIFGIALSVDKLVSVENTLSRFVATLTESFAHLSTGLVIFDHERRVSIFNPALADTMLLDPGWLAGGPTFREFMSRIREVQMLPEQKTTQDWRDFIGSIERRAEEGQLNEEWILPSGQTLRLTGRPHPHGAIVLMIEDITDGVHLERRYRSELEQSRATLEYLSEAICVFDTAGVLIYSNAACADLWGFDPRALTEGADILTMTERWSGLTQPTPVWGDLREFVTSLEQRASWSATVDGLDGAGMKATFAPLPDGSTLTAFSQIARSASYPYAEKMHLPGTELLSSLSTRQDVGALAQASLSTAIEAVLHEQGLSKSLRATLRDAKDFSNRILGARDLPREVGSASFEEDMRQLVAGAGIDLAFSFDGASQESDLSPHVTQILLGLVLIARDFGTKDQCVDFTLASFGTGSSIACMFRKKPDTGAVEGFEDDPAFRMLKRLVKMDGGEVTTTHFDQRDTVQISCTIPTQQTASVPAVSA